MKNNKLIYYKDGHVIKIKDGFSWLALFFGFWWFFYHKLWIAGFSWLAVYLICIGVKLFILKPYGLYHDFLPLLLVVEIAYSIVQGSTANHLLIANLRKLGYAKR